MFKKLNCFKINKKKLNVKIKKLILMIALFQTFHKFVKYFYIEILTFLFIIYVSRVTSELDLTIKFIAIIISFLPRKHEHLQKSLKQS